MVSEKNISLISVQDFFFFFLRQLPIKVLKYLDVWKMFWFNSEFILSVITLLTNKIGFPWHEIIFDFKGKFSQELSVVYFP